MSNFKFAELRNSFRNGCTWTANGNPAVFTSLLAIVSIVAASAEAQISPNYFGIWATNPSKCGDPSAQIVIQEEVVKGPDFRCSIGAPIPGIGTGLAGWDAECSYTGGQSASGAIVIDAGNGPTTYLNFPERDGSVSPPVAIYLCRSSRPPIITRPDR
jgi:hypothetical protein